jgi:hypothetical protein
MGRAKRNPSRFRTMSMMGFASALPILQWNGHAFAFSRHVSPELCFVAPPSSQEGAGKAGCRLAPAVRCKSLTVATTARTTRFCRTHGSLAPQGSKALCTLPSKYWRDEPDGVARRHEVLGSRRAIRPALDHPHPTLPRPTQARLAKNDDTRSLLKDEPGWGEIHAISEFR